MLELEHERAKNLASALQSVIFSAAIIVGGIFTLYTFHVLNSIGQAHAELAILEGKLKSRLLDLKIESVQESLPDDGARYLRVTVFAENKGNTAIKLKFEDAAPIWIAQITSFGDQNNSTLQLGSQLKAHFRIGLRPDENIVDQDVEPTEIYRYPAVFRLNDPGVYLIVFEAAIQEDKTAPAINPRRWVASTYTFVR